MEIADFEVKDGFKELLKLWKSDSFYAYIRRNEDPENRKNRVRHYSFIHSYEKTIFTFMCIPDDFISGNQSKRHTYLVGNKHRKQLQLYGLSPNFPA